ncbi:BppU family phage baseplate upper protein [Enterococcus casseliflavus]|uniref:BppU family phage baseplate upper protein n=1 Tax=Enterococcus casseliflavus TaxID=37734 RepID=UPI003D0D39E8
MATITHNLTLSTTDFNLVGDIKVRQADDETQIFDVIILENGLIKRFDGLKPFFCLLAREVTGQGVSEEPVNVYEDSQGKLQYTVSANAMQMVGRNEAYFSFRKESTNGRWIEQFSTKSFYYTVEKSIYTQPFKDSNYWFTFSELYRKFMEYQSNGKITWEEFVEQNREIIESVDPGGIVLTELIDSRVTLDGTSFPRLSERLFVVDEANEFNQLLTNQLGLVNGIEVVGHRGMGGLYPEGTIPAFRNSILRGHADSIEFDIRSSVDDELYILHDTTVDRTTNGTGSIASLTSTYLNSLDAGSKFSPIYEGAQLPTLDNALKQIQGLPFTRLYPQTNVGEIADETKRKELFSKTYNLFKNYGLLSRTTLAFPHLNLLQEYRSLAPDVRFMLMCGSQTSIVQGAYDQAIADKNCSIGADVAFWINNPTWGAKCKNAGIEPIAWSVRIDHLEPLRKVGVNVMITDEDLKGVFF